MTEQLPDYVLQNRDHWDGMAKSYADSAERHWAQREPSWGIWGIPEFDVRMIPSDIRGQDVIELGCGTAYVAAWLARRGRVTGIDNSEAQLATARRMQKEHSLDFPSSTATRRPSLTRTPASTSRFPSTARASGRILSSGFRKRRACCARAAGFISSRTDTCTLCAPPLETDTVTDRLQRPAFGLHRLEWPDDTGSSSISPWALGPSLPREWIRGGRAARALSAGGATTRFTYVTAEWARQWPSEEVWKVRKRG
jgi:hypothetical protein